MATPAQSASSAENVPCRAMITTAVIGAALRQSLNQTITNVALPYMQGGFSARHNEITLDADVLYYCRGSDDGRWCDGWAQRFGYEPLYLGCIVSFTFASMLCVSAQSLGQIIAFRLLPGMFSARWCRCHRPPCSTSISTSGVASPWRS
jgi:DHA2 family multidrug resistance protein